MIQRKIKNRISIVEKVIYRSLSKQKLGLIIHNHLNYRIYVYWSTETGNLNAKSDCMRSCKALKNSGVAALAVCLVRRITYDGDHRIQRSIFSESYLGKSHCVEKVLSGMPKGTKYMPVL